MKEYKQKNHFYFAFKFNETREDWRIDSYHLQAWQSHSDCCRSPTCLKQKGMVSTLTPTMLFTTFMIKPQFDAVILTRFVTVLPSPGKNQTTRRQLSGLIEGERWFKAVWQLQHGDRAGSRQPPPISDVALCETKQASIFTFSFAAGLTLSVHTHIQLIKTDWKPAAY